MKVRIGRDSQESCYKGQQTTPKPAFTNSHSTLQSRAYRPPARYPQYGFLLNEKKKSMTIIDAKIFLHLRGC